MLQSCLYVTGNSGNQVGLVDFSIGTKCFLLCHVRIKYNIYIRIYIVYIKIQFVHTQTHQLLRERATERYENCCDEVYPLADGHGRAGIFIFDL